MTNNTHDNDRIEQVSAYLDGESADPNAARALLESDSRAAALYDHYKRLSTHLRQLPAPEVHPAFATRVLARCRAEAPARRRLWWKAASLAAGIAVVSAIAVLVVRDRGGETSAGDTDPLVTRVLDLRQQPEAVLEARFDGLLAEAGAPAWTMSDDPVDDTEEPTVAYEALATFAALTDDAIVVDDDPDVFAALDNLSDAERQALRMLLTELEEGGTEIL